jgi:DNA-binding transcriptional LysR family regulator
MPNDIEELLLRRTFNWDDIRVFVAVADAGSLKKAASRLLLTQPTVTKRLDVLESALGVRLLNRTHRGVELTEAGKVVSRYAQSMRRSAYDLHREIAGLDSERQGKVKVFVPDGLAGHWLAPRLADFYDQSPDIGLEFVSTLDTSFMPELQVDVSVQIDECKHIDAIAARLGYMHYLPYATASYMSKHGSPRSLAELSSHRILHHLNYRFQSDQWGEKVKALEHVLSFGFMTNCSTALLNAIRADAGIGLLPTYVESFAEELQPIDLGIDVRIEFWAVFHRDNGQIARVRAVIDWLKSQFNSEQFPWFSEHLYSIYLPSHAVEDSGIRRYTKIGRPITMGIRAAMQR